MARVAGCLLFETVLIFFRYASWTEAEVFCSKMGQNLPILSDLDLISSFGNDSEYRIVYISTCEVSKLSN